MDIALETSDQIARLLFANLMLFALYCFFVFLAKINFVSTEERKRRDLFVARVFLVGCMLYGTSTSWAPDAKVPLGRYMTLPYAILLLFIIAIRVWQTRGAARWQGFLLRRAQATALRKQLQMDKDNTAARLKRHKQDQKQRDIDDQKYKQSIERSKAVAILTQLSALASELDNSNEDRTVLFQMLTVSSAFYDEPTLVRVIMTDSAMKAEVGGLVRRLRKAGYAENQSCERIATIFKVR